MPYRDIASKLNISSTAVKNRVDQLKEIGILREFSVQLTLSMMGSEALILWIMTDGGENQDVFISELGSIPGVIQVSSIFGGGYLIYGEYVGSQGLLKLSTALKTMKHVKSVDIRVLATNPGKSITFSKTQLRILKSLQSDARKPVKEIASETGLTARKVKRIIDELRESKSIQFTHRWSIGAGDRLAFFLDIQWDEKQIAGEELLQQLLGDYPEEIWNYFLTATGNFLLVVGIVDSLKEIEKIASKIRSSYPVKGVKEFIAGPSHNFESIRKPRLQEIISEANL